MSVSRPEQVVLGKPGAAPPHVAQSFRYMWRPASDIAGDLPERFRLTMDCLVGPDHLRRFVPSAGVELFLREASVGGLAILNRTRGLSAEERFSYRVMQLIFQIASSVREHLGRSFKRTSDLFVPACGRASWGSEDILPDRIGFDANGHGERWTVSELFRRGRDFAAGLGDPTPNEDQSIAAGLLVGARLDPLSPDTLSETESKGLVRMALFEAGSGSAPDEDARQVVTERLLAALERHIDDDDDTFRRWFFECPDNLVHQIAKQKKHGGPLSREIVRDVILTLVFEAYGYVADCIHLQMRAFQEAIREPLAPNEHALFETTYFKQPHFGGLSLILLRERFGFLRGAILEILNAPGTKGPVGVLLRLLSYYEEMTSKRRQVDRAYKRHAQHRNETGHVARTLPLTDALVANPRKSSNGGTGEIAKRLCKERGISCACRPAGSWTWELLSDMNGDWQLLIRVECSNCGRAEPVEIKRSEFERIATETIDATRGRYTNSGE